MEIKLKSKKEIFEEQQFERNKADDLIDGKIIDERRNQIEKIMRADTFEGLKKRALRKHGLDLALDHDPKDKDVKKGLAKFHIGTKDKLLGQISFIENEEKQTIVLGKVVRKLEGEGGMNSQIYNGHSYKHYILQQTPSEDKEKIWDTIEADFYLYKFTTKEKTYQMFSTEKLDLGEYHVWGTCIDVLDDVDLGNSAKIQKKLPLLFVHAAFPDENEIQGHDEFFELFEKYNLDEKKFIDWLYTTPQGWVNEYPKSFSYIQIANFLGCPDEANTFHLPIMMIGGTGTGKTTATELIFNRMGEMGEFTDLTSSTIKGLIPSFANPNNLRPGLFLTTRRYAPVDEMFVGVSSVHQDDKSKVMESMKNVLDYKRRAHRSGNGDIIGEMRSEHIALTNPKGYGNDIRQLSKHFEPENLTRYLIWYIKDSQRDFIKEKKGKRQKGKYTYISDKDFQAGVDYLHTFNCDYDFDKAEEIYQIGKNFLDSKGNGYETLKAVYESRYLEHCCKLIDSLTKFRCWVEGDKSFRSKPQDYDLVKSLWIEMLENWNIGFDIVHYESIKSQ